MSTTKTSIEWTERTWNPVRGCSPVSPGCKNCYAERQGGRFCGPGKPFDGFIQIGKNGNSGPHWTGKVELIDKLLEPLSWRKPSMIFVNSMSDLFHENLSDEAIDRVFAVMELCPQHTFQVLTKRAKRMREYLSFVPSKPFPNASEMYLRILDHATKIRYRFPKKGLGSIPISDPVGWPLPNVWLGVSVEDQQRADERIPWLLKTPAAVRFVSYEPALGPVNFKSYVEWERCGGGHRTRDTRLNWVIVGGESGPGARPFEIEWARDVVKQCRDARVSCFVKQTGRYPNGSGFPEDFDYRKRNRNGSDMSEWPEDIRVRELPR